MYMLLLNHFTFLCFKLSIAFVCACIYLASGAGYNIQ